MKPWIVSFFLSSFSAFVFCADVKAESSVVVYCECILENNVGSHLVLVSTDGQSGNERWRRKLDFFPKSNPNPNECKEKLVAAQYCVR